MDKSPFGVPEETRFKTGEGDSGKGGEDVRSVALMSVLAKCYAAVVVRVLQEEPEPVEWRDLHVGARVARRNGSQGFSSTKQRSWTAWKCGTAFDVAKPGVVSRIATSCTGTWWRRSWSIRQGSVEALFLCGIVAKYVMWKKGRKMDLVWWRRGGRVPLQQHDVGGLLLDLHSQEV